MSDAMDAIKAVGQFKPLGVPVQIDRSVVDYLAEMILVAGMQVTEADGNMIVVHVDNARAPELALQAIKLVTGAHRVDVREPK